MCKNNFVFLPRKSVKKNLSASQYAKPTSFLTKKNVGQIKSSFESIKQLQFIKVVWQFIGYNPGLMVGFIGFKLDL